MFIDRLSIRGWINLLITGFTCAVSGVALWHIIHSTITLQEKFSGITQMLNKVDTALTDHDVKLKVGLESLQTLQLVNQQSLNQFSDNFMEVNDDRTRDIANLLEKVGELPPALESLIPDEVCPLSQALVAQGTTLELEDPSDWFQGVATPTAMGGPVGRGIPFPLTTHPGTNSCNRIPALSVASWGFVLTYNHIHGSCSDSGESSQTITMYQVRRRPDGSKSVDIIANIWINDGINRKSCAVAAGKMTGEAYLFCTVITKQQLVDWSDDALEDCIFEKYYYNMLITRNRFQPPATVSGKQLKSIFMGAGTAVYTKGVLHVAAYGTVETDGAYPDLVMCPTDACPSATLEQCKNATLTGSGKLRVALFLTVSTSLSLTNIRMGDLSVLGEGDEGSLIMHGSNYYYFGRSSTWYRRFTVWRINDYNNVAGWTRLPNIRLSQSGWGSCSSANDCPKKCVSGVNQVPDILTTSLGTNIWVVVATSTINQRNSATFFWGDPTAADMRVNNLFGAGPAAYSVVRLVKIGSTIYVITIVEKGPGLRGELDITGALYEWSLM